MDQVFSYTLKRHVPPAEVSFEDFKLTVVSDASDDWLGVYEVWWQANGWHPDWLLSERLALAERAVRELLSEGLAELLRGESWEGDKEGPTCPFLSADMGGAQPVQVGGGFEQASRDHNTAEGQMRLEAVQGL